MDVLDILFPVVCVGCGKKGRYLCSWCIVKAKSAKPNFFGSHTFFSYTNDCHCKTKQLLDYTYSAWEYSGIIRKVILQLKYRFAYSIADDLAARFVEKLNLDIRTIPKRAVLIPVPLSNDRKKWRGFNQSELLGEIIAQNLKWDYEPNCLIRIRKTPPQAELKRKERVANLLNAFSLKEGYEIKNKIYILFDDVLTTGSTLKEACKVLKKSGAKTVWGITIAS